MKRVRAFGLLQVSNIASGDGVQMSLLYAGPPVGQIIVGASVERVGLQPTFIFVAGLFSVSALLVISLPALRDLSRDCEKI